MNEHLLPSLEASFYDYFEKMRTKDFDALVEYIVPFLFEIVPKEAILSGMKTMDDPPAIKDAFIQGASPILYEKGHYYAVLEYYFSMLMPIDPKESKLAGDIMDSLTQITFGQEALEHTPDGLFRKIHCERALYAFRAKQASDWKFLEKKPQSEALARMAIPPKTLAALEAWGAGAH